MGEPEDGEEDVHCRAESKAKTCKKEDGRSGPKYTVLLVEDDHLTCKLVASSLKSCSYDVMEAENGRIALEILDSEKGKNVDIVLTDNMMPEVTGIELVDKLMGAEQRLPVVVMSSDYHEDVVFRALEAGASDFLVKPLSREKLISLWKHAISIAGTPKGKMQAKNMRTIFDPKIRPVKKLGDASSRPVSSSAKSAFQPLQNGKRTAVDVPAFLDPKRSRHNLESTAPILAAEASKHCVPYPGVAWTPNLHQGALIDLTKGEAEASPLVQQMRHASWPGISKIPAAFSPVPRAYQPAALARESLFAAWPGFDVPKALLEIKPLLRTDKSSSGQDQSAHSLAMRNSGALMQDGKPEAGITAGSLACNSLHRKAQGSAFTSVLPRTNAAGPNKGPLLHQVPSLAKKQHFPAIAPDPSVAVSRLAMQQQLLLQAMIHPALPQRPQTQSTTTANRRAAIERFRAKRNQRSFEKKVRYTSRQRLAENRPRIRGQFVKANSHDDVDSKDAASTPETPSESPDPPN